MLHVPRHVVLLNWASAIWEGVGLVWPLLSAHPAPTAGRHEFNSLPGAQGLFVLSSLSALWLSVPSWHTRDRMITYGRIAGALGLVGMLVSGVFGLPLVWAALAVWREIRRERAHVEATEGA
jgi:hypothetical protein